MKASIAATAAIILASASAQPSSKRQQTADPNFVAAIGNWQADTGAVSSFLDSVATFVANNDNTDFLAAANSALTSENDELTWKGILDAEICQTGDPNFDPNCAAAIATANNQLVTLGSFGAVVAELQSMTAFGIGDAEIRATTINCGTATIGGRCSYVLPAINTYFQWAAFELCNYYGDCSQNGKAPIYPQSCSACPGFVAPA